MTLAPRRVAAAATVAWLVVPAALAACPVCFQVEDGPAADGVRVAVLVLMGVATGVLAGFAVFIARFVRRSQ
ncbi:MAG TPA: hypothetical protein VLT86_19365 [Vicinamibacterales bacterium]|nr:hypothetical protein [Vicinamibacterales bacterium]